MTQEFGAEYYPRGQAGVITFTDKGPIHGLMRERMDELGLKYKDLAGICGLSISRIEQFGLLRGLPKPEVAQIIADKLGEKVEDLFPPYLGAFLNKEEQETPVVELCESDVSREELEWASQLDLPQLPTSKLPDPFAVAERKELEEEIENMCSALETDEKKCQAGMVIRLCSGLEGRSYTFAEIAEQLGLPDRDAVRSEFEKALRFFRNPLWTRRLVEYAKEDEVLGTTAGHPRALLNGVVTALCQDDIDRVQRNIVQINPNSPDLSPEDQQTIVSFLSK